jgi:hypothetical protein
LEEFKAFVCSNVPPSFSSDDKKAGIPNEAWQI